MLEIKLRAWDKLKRKITDVIAINWLEGYVTLWKLTGSVRSSYMAELDSVELIQYTGRKDSNGREIYYKDLLIDPMVGETWLVEWSDEYAGFELQRITENTIHVKGIMEKLSACRITNFRYSGNAYENSELLKGDK